MSSVACDVVARFTDEPTLTENALKVLQARYLKKNEAGECIETAGGLFRRVAKTVADVELRYGGSEIERRRWEDRFYRLMANGHFMPNSPTLMNAGREMGMLSACFVLPVRDSIVDIFNSIKHTALIQKAGGGTGFAFDELRPTGDFIQSSGGTTSGPITFWKAFSEATNAIQQGAFRRGANMGMMYIHHPDILKFLHAKEDLTQFTNYNISVKVTDQWMDEFLADPDSPHVVRNPRNGKAFVLPRDLVIMKYDVRHLVEINCVEPVPTTGREKYFRTPRLVAEIPSELLGRVYTKREIWDIIVNNAWRTGEPGVVFIDRINEHNPTPHVGRIEATNPCGEQPLLPYEACNLGSVNLGLFIDDACTPAARVNWDGLRTAIYESTRFLDNIIDANEYPLPEIEYICRTNRKIGLGVMGFADALYKLNVAYNSDAGVAWGERFMKFLNDEGHNCSEQLARERGCFENWQGSIWQTRHGRVMRNAATTTVAPTGTISIIANCSGGIEPMFSLAFVRNVLKGQRQGEKPLVEVNETFLQVARDRGFYSEALIERIAREGTLHHIDGIPQDVRDVFVCAHDITPEWHMKMQAAFQRHCDASISKTINFPNTASREDVETIYRLAYELRCKGVTVYRDGCRSEQPMALKNDAERKKGTGNREPGTEDRDEGMEASRHEGADQSPDRKRGAAPTQPLVAPAVLRTVEPMDLPEIVSGLRIRQLTPFGNMHVKITVDPVGDRELEVFAQLGKGGDVANGDLEAICRMVSLWLRAGGSLRHVIKQLEGIGTSLQVPTKVGRIMSLGDGVACALKKYQRAKERFGLRALLLGEVTPAQLDNPNLPLHTEPATDRLVMGNREPGTGSSPGADSASVNGHCNGNGAACANGNGAATEPAIVNRLPAVTPTPKSAPGPSNANGGAKRHASLAGGGESMTALVEIAESATEQRMIAAASLTEVFGEVKHRHDSALHYKVVCPECSSTLMLQEGCRKCYNCGWSAC
jgi:ribonucleoside-diphosphate reductase alpha chain